MDPVTVEVSTPTGTGHESGTVEGLVVETVTAVAGANATAETALQNIGEVSDDVAALENEVREIEEWQRGLTTQVGTISEQTAHLTQGFQAMSETMTQMLALLQTQVAQSTPANMSGPGADGTPTGALVPSASPSETPQAPEAEAPANPEAARAEAREQQKHLTHWL